MGWLPGLEKNLMRRVLYCVLCMPSLIGCHEQEIAKRSHFDLDKVPDRQVQALTSVTITDDRPAWEGRSYTGTFTLIPLDNLHPSPLEHLKHAFQEELTGLPDPPSDLRLML